MFSKPNCPTSTISSPSAVTQIPIVINLALPSSISQPKPCEMQMEKPPQQMIMPMPHPMPTIQIPRPNPTPYEPLEWEQPQELEITPYVEPVPIKKPSKKPQMPPHLIDLPELPLVPLPSPKPQPQPQPQPKPMEMEMEMEESPSQFPAFGEPLEMDESYFENSPSKPTREDMLRTIEIHFTE
jgi:hypothetical protein